MKKSILTTLLSFALIVNSFFSIQAAQAQDDGKKMVHMKTEKIIDGKKTVKDTTFYINSDENSFSWNSENENITTNDSSLYSKVEVEINSDGKTENHKQMIFVYNDSDFHTVNVSDAKGTSPKKIIIHSKSSGNNVDLNNINPSDIETIDISKEFSSELNDSVKVIKIVTKDVVIDKKELKKEIEIKEENGKRIIKTKTTDANGNVTEEVKELNNDDQKEMIWIETDSKSDKKELKKEIEIKEENGKRIIKIKTTDANGNVTEEVKELNNDDQKEMIWIETDSKSDKKELKKEIEIKEENGKKIIKIKTTDANGNVTEEIQKLEYDDIEQTKGNKSKRAKKERKAKK